LHERWEHIKEGIGRVVLLSGEAGIGKSRLVQALHEHLVGETQVRIECRCSPYYQNSALYPIIEHLQWLLQWQRSDTPQEKLRKLEEAMALYGFTQQEAVPLLAALLSLALPEYYTPLALTPQRQKHKTLEILLIWLVREAERRPIRFIMEDLHWVDPSTLDFLSLLIDQAPTIRMLVLLTFRPDFTPPSAWTSRSHVAHIALSRLPRRQVQTMIERMTSGKALPVEILRQLVDKTDGVPLFVEELTRMVLESGLVQEHNGRYEITAPLSSLAIPVTLQDSLMARLDRLSPVKDVVQLAATLGREFSYELIRAVSPLDEVKLQQGLAQLVEAEVLYQRGLPPQATYVFKHTLIQDAAYQSLLRRVRQRYHRQIAHVLVERFPDISSTQPELVAHHYTVAGLHYEAVWYWQQAAQNAINRSANVEAIRHLRQGLAILDSLPDTPERAQQELTLQLTLGIPLMATQGYTAPEVAQAAARALELCQQLGETSKLLSALSGLFGFHVMRAELQTARELGEQFFQAAQRTHSLPRLLGAHWALGLTLCHLGELGLARDHLEQGIHLYRPQEHRSRAFLHGQDAGVACLSYAGWILGILGYADLARQHTSQALAVAQELSHPFSRAFALAIAALAEQQRREPQAAYAHAQAAVLVSTEEGFPHWLAEGMMVQGWVMVEQGQGPAGIAQIRQGLAAYRATATTLGLPMFLAYLAEACGKVGQVEEGLSVLAEAFDLVETSGERFYAAELHRLKGELLLQSAGHTAEAEICLQQALTLARQQHAKTWELRAAMSLSQLWQQQGKPSAARQLLAEIYDWFKEGLTTADLKAAATLLAELT
jgi:predicted ATPase